jgi:polysaccharide export outer membrane protein
MITKQFETLVPTDTENDDLTIEMLSLEQRFAGTNRHHARIGACLHRNPAREVTFMWFTLFVPICSMLLVEPDFAQMLTAGTAPSAASTPNSESRAVALGPDDEVTLRVLGVEDIDGKLTRIDVGGYIDVPLVGKIKAAGLTVDQLETELTRELKKYVREPHVSVTVSQYRSQSVSVLGAVNTPGAYNLAGDTTLTQILARAGGLRNDAGNSIEISRRRELGPIPLASSQDDPSGEFRTARVKVRSLLEASDPRQNIPVKPMDVISVPKAELVYVAGAVRKPGGFVLNEREHITVLQAVSMAEGMDRTSAPSRAKIIRAGTTEAREEIPVDLFKIVSGKSPDVPLLANDILVVPTSGAKAAFYRSVEAAIQTGVGVAVYH